MLTAVITAEIGEVSRFKNAGQRCSWAGLTPRHRESGAKVARGHVTKPGSRLLRWALIEAIQRIPKDCVIGAAKDAIIARCGKEAKNIAKVAAARQLLTLVFYGMRDGQIRCLATPARPVARRRAGQRGMTGPPAHPRPGARGRQAPPGGGRKLILPRPQPVERPSDWPPPDRP